MNIFCTQRWRWWWWWWWWWCWWLWWREGDDDAGSSSWRPDDLVGLLCIVARKVETRTQCHQWHNVTVSSENIEQTIFCICFTFLSWIFLLLFIYCLVFYFWPSDHIISKDCSTTYNGNCPGRIFLPVRCHFFLQLWWLIMTTFCIPTLFSIGYTGESCLTWISSKNTHW